MSKELDDLIEKRRQLDLKLQMHAASMGGTRLPRKTATKANAGRAKNTPALLRCFCNALDIN